MKRLFVAIDLPGELRSEIAGFCRRLPSTRPVVAEQLHLTLRFIGEVDDRCYDGIKKALASVRFAEFQLELRGAGCFPSVVRPRVLWLGLAESPQLMNLQRQIESSLVAVGVTPEERPFAPHITLARFREASPADISPFLRERRDLQLGPFTVGEFYLYSSLLGSSGATHRREAAYRSIVL